MTRPTSIGRTYPRVAGLGIVQLTLGDLFDVDLTGVADGDIIVWDDATSTWVVQAPSGSALEVTDGTTSVTPTDTIDFDPAFFYVTSPGGGVAGVTFVGASGSTVDIEDEGVAEGAADTIDFVGAGVSVAFAGGTATVTIPGGGGGGDDPIADIFGVPDTAFEFDSSSLAGLTGVGTPDAEDADTTVPDCLYYRDDTSGPAWMMRYLASPSTPFTAITKVTDHNFRNDFNGAGLIVGVSNPGTGAFTTCIVAHNVGRIFNAEKFTNRTTFSSTLGGGGISNPGVPCYLAVVVNSTTSIDYLWSLNGRIWRRFVTANNPSLTVGSIGLGFKSENSNGAAVAFDFLRIWNSAKTFPGV